MGTDINVIMEVQANDGLWYEPSSYEVPGMDFTDGIGYNDFPFRYRSYSLFGFLANVRNTSCVPSITDHRGLPEGSVWLGEQVDDQDLWAESNHQKVMDGHYGHTWVTLQELLAFDYSQQFEELRLSKTTHFPGGGFLRSGNVQGVPGEGHWLTVREFLGKSYFHHLEGLKHFGEPSKVRVILYFD